MAGRWIDGNDIRLLENGEEFFPRVFDVHRATRSSEVVLETFILFEDKVGAAAARGAGRRRPPRRAGRPDHRRLRLARPVRRLHRSLTRRGRAHACVRSRASACSAGALNMLRRMHRKIVVVDGEVAFVGGINYSADHLADFGPEAKQDYAVEIRGPLVAEIHRFTHAALAEGQRHQRAGAQWWRRRSRLRAQRPSSCRTRAAPRPCSWCATTARTPTTSSGTTASRSAPRASASSSPTRTSFPAIASSRSCAAPRAAASTCG